jgi:hypothetical protein
MSDGAGADASETTVGGGADAAAVAADTASKGTESTLVGGSEKQAAGDKGAEGTTEKAGEKKADTKAEAPKPVEWEKWSPKAIEGLERPAEQLKAARDIFQKHGFSAEQAQAVVDLSDSFAREQAQSDIAHLEKVQTGWRESLKSDSDYGGAHLKSTAADVERVMKRFDGRPYMAELRRDLNETRFGDHPGLIKLLADLGKSMREDKVITGTQSGSSQTFLDQLYPTSAKS